MKTILFICMVVFVNGMDEYNFPGILKYERPLPLVTNERKSAATSEEYFSQNLDHFDSTDTTKWSQRYFVNDEYLDTAERNVAFLMVEGEEEAADFWMTYGPWVTSARKYKAILFQLEHRFYGKSQPFADLKPENMRYLSSQQALADLATFINAMNKKHQLSSDVQWILFGGSYSGSLAAWMREKYPHLVRGAVSASSPLLAKLDFYEYVQVVTNALADYSQECIDNVRTGINQIEDFLKSPSTAPIITALFNLCDPIEQYLDNGLDLANFFNTVKRVFTESALYHKIPGAPTPTIDHVCEIMTTNNSPGSEYYHISEVYKLRHSRCVSYRYETLIQFLKNVTIGSSNTRQWTYQTCTEFGWFQTTNQELQIFGNRSTVDFYTKMCSDAYGELFNANYTSQLIERTNMDYGALNIETTNIVYVHGTVDPWHPAGLTNTTNPESPAILVDGAAHCAALYDESPGEPPQLKAARNEVDRLIGVWLGINSN